MRTRRPRTPTTCARVGVGVLLAVGGCSSTPPAGEASHGTPPARATTSSVSESPSDAATSSRPVTTASTTQQPTAPFTKVLLVVLENHSQREAEAGMPLLREQAEKYAVATRSYAVTHPSLPNYLAIAGGSTFGVRDDRSPAAHGLTGESVFGQVLQAGGTAKTYAEGMFANCQTRPQGRYAVKHNPWPYFTDTAERAACRRFDVPAGRPGGGALHDDIAAGRLPTFSMLIPDLCNDAHDCALKTADAWVRSWLRAVTAGPDFTGGRLLVVVTFDEDDGDAENHVLTVFVHPALSHATIDQRFDHFAVSGLASRMVAAQPLRRGGSGTDLAAAVTTAMRPH